MKKAYMKPEIMFESFVSSTNIATNCKLIISGHALDMCALEHYDNKLQEEPWYIFTSKMQACTTNDGDEDSDWFDRICYHVPVGESTFNS